MNKVRCFNGFLISDLPIGQVSLSALHSAYGSIKPNAARAGAASNPPECICSWSDGTISNVQQGWVSDLKLGPALSPGDRFHHHLWPGTEAGSSSAPSLHKINAISFISEIILYCQTIEAFWQVVPVIYTRLWFSIFFKDDRLHVSAHQNWKKMS